MKTLDRTAANPFWNIEVLDGRVEDVRNRIGLARRSNW
jgi:hypothetical protein